jgi:transcriptional regulator with XRE-family HTH domain
VYGRLKGHDRYFYYATNPKADMLEKLADFFGVSIDYFFGREASGDQIIGNNIGNNNNVGKVTIQSNLKDKVEYLQNILTQKDLVIKEKDKRIEAVEKMNDFIINHIKSDLNVK